MEDAASVCFTDPGFPVDVTIRSTRAALYRVYLGRESMRAARRTGSIEVIGSAVAVRRFGQVFRTSPVAEIVAAAQQRTGR
jgi:hypothetical protein